MQRILFRFCSLGILGLGIAACADQRPAPAPVAAVPSGPVTVDGIYQGYATLTEASDTEETLCGTNVPLTLTVTDRTFTYDLAEPQVRYAPVKRFLVQINPDGSFNSQSGGGRLQGNISGKGMNGDAFGEACTYHFTAARP